MNLNESVKSKGIVVFAFNTSSVDYVTIADRTSRLANLTLGLPVTLITDKQSQPVYAYDQIIRVDPQGDTWRDNDTAKRWRNFGRHLAYELSPYSETLLLDTDYLVFDQNLLKLFETEFDYRLMHHNRNDQGPEYEMMGETSLPFVWATVVLFRKSERARLFFDLVGRIQRNYNYYRALFNIREGNYRNDYAFAIANVILSGYSINEDQSIPWCMYTVTNKVEDIKFDTHSRLRIYYKDRATVAPQTNIHVMDKDYLQSENFDRMIRNYCEQA